MLAIYLLTVLAPLHQARASQLAFEQLGYSTLQTGWVLCSAAGEQAGDGDVLIAKCPAAGTGKAEFVLPVPDVLPAGLDLATLAAPLPTASPAFPPRIATPPGGPRAPPTLV